MAKRTVNTTYRHNICLNAEQEQKLKQRRREGYRVIDLLMYGVINAPVKLPPLEYLREAVTEK